MAETRKGGGTELGFTPTLVALFLQMPLLEVSPRGALQWSCIFGNLGTRALNIGPSLFLCAYD